MALSQLREEFDAAAYLAWEAQQAGRHQYIDGEVFAMVGVRQARNVATSNLAMALRHQLRGERACFASVGVEVGVDEILEDTEEPYEAAPGAGS